MEKKDNCPCIYPCPRNTNCEACKEYHKKNGGKPACERQTKHEP